jgi:hypothetical protein
MVLTRQLLPSPLSLRERVRERGSNKGKVLITDPLIQSLFMPAFWALPVGEGTSTEVLARYFIAVLMAISKCMVTHGKKGIDLAA